MEQENRDQRVFSAMSVGSPYATYKKTILGKVYVTVLNPFSQTPEGMLLQGTKGMDTEFVDVWSEMEDVFFRRMNKKHLEMGMVVKVVRDVNKEEPRTINQYTDEELKDVINLRYSAFQSRLSSVTSEATVYRMLDLASDMEKSEKILTAIRAKLAELQRSAGPDLSGQNPRG